MDQFPLEEIVEKVGSRFAVVVAAAQRAKQIKDGSPPLVSVASRNPLTVALAEIAEGKVLIMPCEDTVEEVTGSNIDEYFAGRDRAVEDIIPYRRPRKTAEAGAEKDDDDDFDDDDEDDGEDDDIFDDDE